VNLLSNYSYCSYASAGDFEIVGKDSGGLYFNGKGKISLSLIHSASLMKIRWGRGRSYSSTILDVGARWRRVASSRTGQFIHEKKEPPVPIGCEAGPVLALRRREKYEYVASARSGTPEVQFVVRYYTD
jgi:hypothetical protein